MEGAFAIQVLTVWVVANLNTESKRGGKRESQNKITARDKVSALKYKNNLNDSVKVKRAKQSHTLGINSSLPDYCFSYN